MSTPGGLPLYGGSIAKNSVDKQVNNSGNKRGLHPVSVDGQLNSKGNRRGMHPNSKVNLEKGRVVNKRTQKDYSITRIVKEMLDQAAEER